MMPFKKSACLDDYYWLAFGVGSSLVSSSVFFSGVGAQAATWFYFCCRQISTTVSPGSVFFLFFGFPVLLGTTEHITITFAAFFVFIDIFNTACPPPLLVLSWICPFVSGLVSFPIGLMVSPCVFWDISFVVLLCCRVVSGSGSVGLRFCSSLFPPAFPHLFPPCFVCLLHLASLFAPRRTWPASRWETTGGCAGVWAGGVTGPLWPRATARVLLNLMIGVG